MTTQTKRHSELKKKVTDIQVRIAELLEQSEQIIKARDARSDELVQAYINRRDTTKLVESQDQDNQKIRAIRAAVTAMQAEITTVNREINAENVKEFIQHKAEFNKTLISFMDDYLIPATKKFAEFEKAKDELLSHCAVAGVQRLDSEFPFIELQIFDSMWYWLNRNSMPVELTRLETVFPEIFKAARAAK